MTSTTIETNTPTYSWATALGAFSSIAGLVVLAVCIAVSATHAGPDGFAPIPYGTTTLACCLTLGGLVLILFRILHADREEVMRRLEVMDEKLNNVWGIAARTSIEAKPVRGQQHTQRRSRRRPKAASGQGGDSADAKNVVPLRARRAKDALRRLSEHIKGENDA